MEAVGTLISKAEKAGCWGMSRQEAGGRDPGKSLAQPANSVSFFVNRRVSKASQLPTFCSPASIPTMLLC